MKTFPIIVIAVALYFPAIPGFAGVEFVVDTQEILSVPTLSLSKPAAGKRVAVTPAEYAGTNVLHTLYLPQDWKPDGEPLPIIFEFTGNYFPRSGSTGQPQDAGLGYGLTNGAYIWVSLPFVDQNGKDNSVMWWGDEEATIEYAKRNVPRIIAKYNADPAAVFLCGFSRGAIGVNYIGLHDDEIAGLWTAFFTHDHFDGAKEWSTNTWGSPLKKYRKEATQRLQRVGTRPYFVSQNGDGRVSEDFVRSALPDVSNFVFGYVDTEKILGAFPNEIAKAAHTDRWPLKPGAYRVEVWTWMNDVANGRDATSESGQLIFADELERNEAQEEKDEPGNGGTTSRDKSAGRHKKVDLRDGTMYIYTHTAANHATSVRHAFHFDDLRIWRQR